MTELRCTGVTYAYEHGAPILDRLDARFPSGAMHAILGPSGSGKSTLLALLAGLERPQRGSITLDGEAIGAEGLDAYRRDHAALVFQQYNLIDHMTAVENVALAARSDPIEALAQVGLDTAQCRRRVSALSGGQRQRVAVARALASGADVILADEPTGNLDAGSAAAVADLLATAAAEHGACVIVVTHAADLAARADTVHALRHGRLARQR